jgi:cation diffusion facilitator CzcD-associated flavoprotein CzcO/acetyl esterase/lipase
LAAAGADIAKIRRVMAGVLFRVPKHIRITPVETLGSCPGEWVESPQSKPNRILLYLHGGGYVACSTRTHRSVTCAFADRGFRVYAPEYRLAPEHRFPAGLDDCVAAYRELRRQYPEASIGIAGDSAGGGLTLATLLRLRDVGEPLPRAAVLFSPLTDLTGTGASRQTNSGRCAMFRGSGFERLKDFYLPPGTDPTDPLASPLYADLHGLPPLLIHVGADETLLDDSTLLAERAREAGVPVQLDVFPVVPHVWQVVDAEMPESVDSVDAAAAFLAREAPELETVIIGGGFAGLCLAIRLRQQGRANFLLLEKANDIGGTWRANTYPGCACDIPSHLYSFSFALNPGWTRMYPSQAEIWQYMHGLVDRYRLGAWIRYGQEVEDARFDEKAARWHVRTKAGITYTARYAVFATGPLSKPARPDIPGLDQFAGEMFHSAEWNHSCQLAGKRVAVIGTGASAIQFVPEIQKQVAHLDLYQRTPNWFLPRQDRPFSNFEKALFRWVPGWMRVFRAFLYLRQEAFAPGFAGNRKWMTRAETMSLDHFAAQVPDAGLRKKLIPDYHIGCKRILISNDYLPALQQPNVSLILDRIQRAEPEGIRTVDGTLHPADVLILGTGFQVTDFIAPITVTGPGGELSSRWKQEGAQAYYGISVAGFPNLFILVGPNTGLGHNSIIFMMESQVRYVLDAMRELDERGAHSLDVDAGVQQRFNARIHARLAKAVWSAGGCKSWYLDEQGRNPTLWPGSTITYWRRTRHFHREAYKIL